ncbi:hypothetical protein EJA72_27165 [Pseudomonas sp. PB120]|uniref:hypothetical protein n=1 Tax=Pseudomonas sp. PB120 TaxID=2494700 RepID=UPI0012FDB7A3|nr:hypothetical protein [Pseudomonas sp. PB120]MVV51892.1 hypothetical protein [Pseudomonas sp. PB120]
MSNRENIKVGTAKGGRIYVVRRNSSKANGLSGLLGALFSYAAALSVVYGLLSFNRPDVIEKAFENKVALGALIFGAGAVLIAFALLMSTLGTATFEKVSSSLDGQVNITSSLSKLGRWAIRIATGVDFAALEAESKLAKSASNDDLVGLKEDFFSYGAVSSDTPFEIYISSILKSLSAYATSSEVTATKLLDKGVAFMAGGLVFYVVAIVIWQMFANLTHPDPNVMFVGMAACSMTFVIVEFLAAWFFKQYRYYVEVSLSCLRVRSVYDRYLLSYYALREFKGEADESIRDKMTEILKEDAGWPTYKGGVANDFNYMIESMGVVHTTMEKMRGVFQSKKETESKADKV